MKSPRCHRPGIVNTQTLIRDVVQPPAHSSQHLLSHCQETQSIFSTSSDPSPRHFHEGLWVEETSPGYELLPLSAVWGSCGSGQGEAV